MSTTREQYTRAYRAIRQGYPIALDSSITDRAYHSFYLARNVEDSLLHRHDVQQYLLRSDKLTAALAWRREYRRVGRHWIDRSPLCGIN